MKIQSVLIAAAFALFATVGFAQDENEALGVGDKAPDFELETFDGETVVLSDRAGENGKPVILLFSRANW